MDAKNYLIKNNLDKLSYKNNKNFNKLLDLFKSSEFILAKELILEDENKYKNIELFQLYNHKNINIL